MLTVVVHPLLHLPASALCVPTLHPYSRPLFSRPSSFSMLPPRSPEAHTEVLERKCLHDNATWSCAMVVPWKCLHTEHGRRCLYGGALHRNPHASTCVEQPAWRCLLQGSPPNPPTNQAPNQPASQPTNQPKTESVLQDNITTPPTAGLRPIELKREQPPTKLKLSFVSWLNTPPIPLNSMLEVGDGFWFFPGLAAFNSTLNLGARGVLDKNLL